MLTKETPRDSDRFEHLLGLMFSDHAFFLQAQVRQKGAGLGARGSSYGVNTADSYKDAVRKAMFARFTEMN